MSDEFHQALEVCIAAMQTGVDKRTCLKLYPSHSKALSGALDAVEALIAIESSDPSPQETNRSRMRVTQAAQASEVQRASILGWLRLPRLAFAVVALAILLYFGGDQILAVSAQAVPGDTLYSVKRAAENLSLQLTGAASRDLLKEDYQTRRLDEIRKLLAAGRIEQVSFSGILEDRSTSFWTISGVDILVTGNTRFLGPSEIGARIDVQGETRPEGWIQAHQIHRREFTLSGVVELTSKQSWIIAGNAIQVRSSSIIDPAIRQGDWVLALVQVEDNGQLLALAIIQSGSGTSQPSPTPTARPTPLPTDTLVSPTPGGRQDLEEIEFEGRVESMSGQRWTIDGKSVRITPETEIKDPIKIGDRVKVHALRDQDQNLIAREIEFADESEEDDDSGSGDSDEDDGQEAEEGEEVEFSGVVQSIGPGSWQIAGKVVQINASTRIEGGPKVGDFVQVEALQLPSGLLLAEKIKLED